MKKSDLKVGYVVVLRDETYGIVMPVESGNIVITVYERSGKTSYCELSNYCNDLTNCITHECDIMAVYGYAIQGERTTKADDYGRQLLWKREVKKMTVSEICKELGYDVEIVKDGDSE